MKIYIKKASDYNDFNREDCYEIRENQTYEDVFNLIEEFDENIIISKPNKNIKDKSIDYVVIIYDDYLE